MRAIASADAAIAVARFVAENIQVATRMKGRTESVANASRQFIAKQDDDEKDEQESVVDHGDDA